MKEYIDADEAKHVAQTAVLPKWHQGLQGATIAYLFDPDSLTVKGRDVWAKIRKATAVETHLTAIDLVLLIARPAWDACTDSQRIALLDHEFCHVEIDETEDGGVVYRMVGHDLEEFRAVVRRHGDWSADITLFNEAQADLFAGQPPEGERIAKVLDAIDGTSWEKNGVTATIRRVGPVATAGDGEAT